MIGDPEPKRKSAPSNRFSLDANSTEALLRAWGSRLPHLQLLLAAAVSRDGADAGSVCADSGRRTRALRIPIVWTCGQSKSVGDRGGGDEKCLRTSVAARDIKTVAFYRLNETSFEGTK